MDGKEKINDLIETCDKRKIEVNKRTHRFEGVIYDLDKQRFNYQQKCARKITISLEKIYPDKSIDDLHEQAFQIMAQAAFLIGERYNAASSGTVDITEVNPIRSSENIIEDIFIHIPIFQSFGDTLGYKNGDWEFNNQHINAGFQYTGEMIFEFMYLGGINDISMDNWLASDDTILYLATYQVLMEHNETIDQFGSRLRDAYLKVVPLMENRHPGNTVMRSLGIQETIEWNKLPYDSQAKGAGSAMRAGCIGIFYPGSHNRDKLIALAITCSIITHNSAIAILGSISVALFTAYAIERVEVTHWPHKFLKLLKSDRIDSYIRKIKPNEYAKFKIDKVVFVSRWEQYINATFSGITPKDQQKIMKNPITRLEQLASNYSKDHIDFPGSCGDDAVIFAYDALLFCKGSAEKLIVFGILNIGDSDTVGSIAMSWFGIVYFSQKNLRILSPNFKKLEYYKKICTTTLEASYLKLNKMINYDLLRHYSMKIINRLKKSIH
jgi:ADP-ribosylglycohydrolase